MRVLAAAFLGSGALVACGTFGSSDTPADGAPQAPPSTPQDNAQPPPVGGPAPPGLYVSSSKGSDDGSGTVDRPMRTLRAGFAAAKQQGLRVVACAEQYKENLVLVDGVSAYGYYDCTKTPWERSTTKRAVVLSPSSPAAFAKGIAQPTRIEGFELRAPDLDGAPATDTAGSSIALEVRDSQALAISEALLHAGKGAPGADGADGPLNQRTTASDGNVAYDQSLRTCNPMLTVCESFRVPGPPGGTTTCAIGPSGGAGGQGGDSRWWQFGTESTGAYEFRGRPLAANAATAVGGLNEDSVNGYGRGLPGTNGAAGAEGADGSNGVWLLTSAGFARGNGTAGGAGGPGQGGGGGGGGRYEFTAAGLSITPPSNTYYATASGGGGGGGGCGGQPGTPATGGGASIGALAVKSGVVFERMRIETSAGGRAGKGNLGIAGGGGGSGGAGTFHSVDTTGKGGTGGTGGNGGASGHGAPGPSIALAWFDKKPAMNQVDLAPGEAGAGQPELKRVVGGAVGTKVLPAATGVAEAEHEIKL